MGPKSSCWVKNGEGVVFLNFAWKETFEEIPVPLVTEYLRGSGMKRYTTTTPNWSKCVIEEKEQ